MAGTMLNGPRGKWLGLALAIGAALLLAAPARADYAVLRSGQRLHVTSYQRVDGAVVLQLEGGSVSVPAEELAAIEPEDTFVAAPPSKPDGPYAEEIRKAALAYDMDERLITCVIAVESNFDPHAVSRKAARGLMQLLPETAARLAVRDIFDPQQNIDAGTRYLKELLSRYNQNLALALAAYNAGPEAVDQYRGIPPFAETRKYVRRVTEKLRTQFAASGKQPF